MSFATAKYIQLQDKKGPVFRGGLITNSEPNTIPYSNTPYARNFRVNGQGISIRPGFSQFGSSFAASGTAKGIGAYLRSDPTLDAIITQFDVDGTHKLVAVNPITGAQTSIATGANITTTVRMNFQSANDSIYCMNGVDNMGKLNGTTYTTPNFGIANFKPSFSAWFDNSLWVSGIASVPNRIYKSAENNPESFTGTGADIFDQTFPIVGMSSSGQTLYIFTDSTIDMINNNSIKQIGTALVYTSVPLEANEGAAVHNSIVSVGKDCYFLTKSNKIKKMAPNGMLHYDVVELSHRNNRGINSIMETLDKDQTKSFAYAIPDKQLIKWHVKSIGATYNDTCIVYNYEYDEFMVDTQKIFFGGVWYKGSSFTISHIEPKIYLDEYAQTDDGAPIQFEYWTKRIDLGDPTIHKELWQLRTFLAINSASSVIQNIYADGSLVDTRTITKSDIPLHTVGIGTVPIGTFTIGTETSPTSFKNFLNTTIGDNEMFNVSLVREKGDLQVRGKYIYLQYICSSLGAKCLLQNAEPRIQTLDQLVSSTKGEVGTVTTNLSPLQDSLGNNITDMNGEQIYSIIQITV